MFLLLAPFLSIGLFYLWLLYHLQQVDWKEEIRSTVDAPFIERCTHVLSRVAGFFYIDHAHASVLPQPE
jgi:hypothetical protein